MTIQGLKCNGEPVYQSWNKDKNICRWSTREIEYMKGGSWRVKNFNVVILEVNVPLNLSVEDRMEIVKKGRESLLHIGGIKPTG